MSELLHIVKCSFCGKEFTLLQADVGGAFWFHINKEHGDKIESNRETKVGEIIYNSESLYLRR